ncbi:serine-rich adhesin for platelets [Brachionus plicatilis]|uniref:Serine-rich adhesin for platelets n=1 Tax=Brachionus plicatilis TaxID=10195 RepID=A0A3M7SQA3_BRAPC|nr:serine-rich adhesin for platelets [Brachionus plicatilis]
MKTLQQRLALSLFFFHFISVSINQSVKAEGYSCTNCSISEYKRCYNSKGCKCLNGLYQQGDKCLGALRYDLNLTLFVSSALKPYNKFAEEIRGFFKKIPDNSVDSQVNTKYGMEIEDWKLKAVENKNEINFFAKLVYWKKKQKNPKDLPSIDLVQMRDFLKNYFKANSKEQLDTLLIDNLVIGTASLKEFQNSFSIDYNELTCKTDQFIYCYDHKLCRPHLGSVMCECDPLVSVDVSPQKDLFPGELCEKGCSKKCQNEGICRLRQKQFVCYCLGWYVGDYCQISIIWFIIVTALLVIIFTVLSILCGFLEGINKRNKKKREQKGELEKTK